MCSAIRKLTCGLPQGHGHGHGHGIFIFGQVQCVLCVGIHLRTKPRGVHSTRERTLSSPGRNLALGAHVTVFTVAVVTLS
jgi:hypothetical protein